MSKSKRSGASTGVGTYAGSFASYMAQCAESNQWRDSQITDEEHIPWWITDDISLLQEMAWMLRDAPMPPTDQTYRAVEILEGHRLKHLGIGMKQAQMADDETIGAYMARIGIPERLVAATMAKRDRLQREISNYWDRAVAHETATKEKSA